MGIHVDYELTIDQLPRECITGCSSPIPAVQHWRETLGFTVNRERAVKCILGCGIRGADELAAKNDDEIAEIVLWLACVNFSEWDGTEDSPCGSNIFVLE